MTKNEIFKIAKILEGMRSSGSVVSRRNVCRKYADLVMKNYVRGRVPKWLFELAAGVYTVTLCSATPFKENSK